jgi:predicted nucleic acid-binding Zn ribbon protein
MKFLTPEEIKIKKQRRKTAIYISMFFIIIILTVGVTYLTYNV